MKVKVFREHYVPKLDRRADALVLLTHQNLGYAFWLEVAVEEKEESIRGKVRSLRDWQDGPEYLSRLFGVTIPYFDVLVLREGEDLCEKLPALP